MCRLSAFSRVVVSHPVDVKKGIGSLIPQSGSSVRSLARPRREASDCLW